MTLIFSLEVPPKTELHVSENSCHHRANFSYSMVVSSCDEAFTARGRCAQPSSYAESETNTFVLQSFRRLSAYVTVSARDGKLHMHSGEEDYSFSIQESYLPIAKKRYPSNFCLLRGHAFFVAATCKVTRNLRLLPHGEYVRGHFQTINVIMTLGGRG